MTPLPPSPTPSPKGPAMMLPSYLRRGHTLACLVLLALLASISSFVYAAEGNERRVALIIGNADYSLQAKLANPTNDARSVAATLRSMGFDDVVLATDANLDDMRAKLRAFSKLSETADIAVVYYAGHGIEVGGANYLVPIGATLKSDRDVEFELVPLDMVMRSVDGARKLKIILVDACRDNPFISKMDLSGSRSRSVGARGLARVEQAPTNSVVVYAAAAGKTADDGRARNSPFASALIKHLSTPNLEVRFAIGRIRDAVLAETDQKQEPYIYASLGGSEIYLNRTDKAPTTSTTETPGRDDLQVELSFWDSVKNSRSPEELRTYLRQYPNGRFADLAKTRLNELAKTAAIDASASTQPASAPAPTPVVSPPVFGGGPVKLGIVGPLTGPWAIIGLQMQRGAEQAVEDINAAGGILGRKIVATIDTDDSDPKRGVSVANKFVGDGVKLVVGHFNSGVTLPASEIYAENGILQITPSASNPKVTERGLWNIFRTCGRDDQQGMLWADYAVKNLRGKKIAIVHDRTVYGQGLTDSARGRLNAAGVREVLYEGIDTGAKDYSALVSKIKASGAEVVMWGGQHIQGGLIVRQMRDKGVRATMLSGAGILSNLFVEYGGEGVIGTLMSFGPDPLRNPAARDVIAKFRAKGTEPEAYTLYAYAAVQIMKQAAEKANSLDSKMMAEVMHSGMTFETVLGDIAYDKKGDRKDVDYVMYTWKRAQDGKIVYEAN